MRWLLSFTLALVAFAGAQAQAQMRKFGDWIAACDNGRDCRAYALKYDSANSYLRIQRNAESVDFLVTIAVATDTPLKYKVATEDPANAIIPDSAVIETERRDRDGFSRFLTEETPQAMAKFLSKAKKLNLVRVEPPPEDPSEPNFDGASLDGARAALAWIDEQQKRAGTEDGFARRGRKARSTVPPPPKLPAVTPARADATPAPQEPPAIALAQRDAACGKEQRDAEQVNTTRLGANLLMVWLFCGQYSGAYNLNHAFLLVADGKTAGAPRPRFVLPARAAAFIDRNGLTGRKDSITNPEWDDERMVLTSFYARRSAGDCGELAEWTWTGREFQLTELRKMPACEGIPASDWPVLYRAARR